MRIWAGKCSVLVRTIYHTLIQRMKWGVVMLSVFIRVSSEFLKVVPTVGAWGEKMDSIKKNKKNKNKTTTTQNY